MKKNLSFKTVGTILFVAAGMFFIFQGCQKDDYFDREKIDQTIATSPELEEYVIAASDFQHSLNAFAHEMNKVDFSNLEIVQDSAGNYVTYLPGIIRSLRVEEKAQIMNEKRRRCSANIRNLLRGISAKRTIIWSWGSISAWP